MPGLTIKNIPDDLYRRLVETARTHHRSIAKEIVVALERHVGRPAQDKEALLERIRAVRERYQPTVSDADIDGWKNAGRQ
jgi:plasmid stability protein